MALRNAAVGDEAALPGEPDADTFRDAGEERGERRANSAVENPNLAEAVPAQQRRQPDQIDAALQFRTRVVEIDGLGNGGLRRDSSRAPLVGGARNVTWPPGDTAAMARMNGRCQMTSPIPGLG